MNSLYEEQIKQLRKASANQNWELFRQALQSLVCLVNPDRLFAILAKILKEFLVDFLQANPVFASEYETYIALEVGVFSEKEVEDISKKMDNHKGEPGINNFRRAISNMVKLFHLEYCSPAYSETFVNTIINLFIAIPSQQWGTENPDLHYGWQHGTKNEDLLILAKYYAVDPKTIERTRSLWMQLADDLETAFTM